MRRSPTILALAAAFALAAHTSSAQTQLHLWVAPASGPDLFAQVDPDGPRVLAVRSLASGDRDWAVGTPTSDGRYMVGVTSERSPHNEQFITYSLTVHDLVGGQTQRVYWGGEAPSFAVHPRRAEVVAARQGLALVIGVGGERRLAAPDTTCLTVAGLSGDGSRAIFRCGSTLRVFDVDSGAIVGEWPVLPGQGSVAALSADGRDVYEIEGMQVRRRAVATAEIVAASAIPDDVVSPPDRLVVSDRTGEVFTVGRRIHVFDASTLELRRARLVPWLTSGGSGVTLASWAFAVEQPRIHAVAATEGGPNSVPILWTLDSETLAVLAQTPIPGQAAVARRVPRPAAPAGLAATVSGTSVTVTWQEGPPAGVPTRYVLEAGSAPGLSNIFSGLDVGLQRAFSAPGVPAGTYYVRVRAGNFSGLGAASSEIVVTVP